MGTDRVQDLLGLDDDEHPTPNAAVPCPQLAQFVSRAWPIAHWRQMRLFALKIGHAASTRALSWPKTADECQIPRSCGEADPACENKDAHSVHCTILSLVIVGHSWLLAPIRLAPLNHVESAV